MLAGYHVHKEKRNLFLDWITNPIVELNLAGEIIYLNLSMRAQFPDLSRVGNKHLLLIGLLEEIQSAKNNNELVMFVREVSYNNHVYEQQVFVVPEVNSIFIYMTDISKNKNIEGLIQQSNEKIKQQLHQKESVIRLMKLKLDTIHKAYQKQEEQLNFSLLSAGVGTWDWNIVKNSLTFDSATKELLGIKLAKQNYIYSDLEQVIHPKDKHKLLAYVKVYSGKSVIVNSSLRVIHSDGSIHKLNFKGKVYYDHQPTRMAGICSKSD